MYTGCSGITLILLSALTASTIAFTFPFISNRHISALNKALDEKTREDKYAPPPQFIMDKECDPEDPLCQPASEEEHSLSEGTPNAEELEEAKDFMTLYMLKKRSQPDPYLDNYYTDGMNGYIRVARSSALGSLRIGKRGLNRLRIGKKDLQRLRLG